MSDQSQKSGDHSVNAQAGRDIVIHGVTASEARQIAVDVMQSKALEYRKEAVAVVEERLQFFSKKIVAEVDKRANANFAAFKDPDFQYVLNQAGVFYARSGDGDVESLLVDLIGERSVESKRTTKQAVLNEALEIGGRVTNDQLKILASIFIPRYTVRYVGTLKEFGAFCNSTLAGFLADYSIKELDFQHLTYLGCVTISSVGSSDIREILKNTYSGLFSRGFLDTEIPVELSKFLSNPKVVISCMNDAGKKQFKAINVDALKKILLSVGATEEEVARATNFHSETTLHISECLKRIFEHSPGMEAVLKRWSDSLAKSTQLTSVGRALAISYLRSKGQTSYSFDTWLQ